MRQKPSQKLRVTQPKARPGLQTCPGCGKGGFLNLKSHRCKAPAAQPVAVELVPAPNEKKLEECATEIRRMHGVIEGKTRRFQEEVIYDFVEWGLYFLQAKQALGRGEFGDFLKSATVADLNISERSARNYMNAARNAGLDHLSTAEDVETLRRSEALHGCKPTELYRLQDEKHSEPPDEPQPTYNLVRDELVSLRERCEALENLRDSMSKKAFSTACARLHRTLESLTKCPWDMVEQRRPEPLFREHGDVYEIGN